MIMIKDDNGHDISHQVGLANTVDSALMEFSIDEKGALPNPCKYHWMKMMTIFNQINNNISYPARIRSNPGAQLSLTRTKKRNPFS